MAIYIMKPWYKKKKKEYQGIWVPKTWYNVDTPNMRGSNIWTDGTDIYLSSGYTVQYVLNKATSTWSVKTWNGDFSNIIGSRIWKGGDNIYHTLSNKTYMLDKANNCWVSKTWSYYPPNDGFYIWTDENVTYYSDGDTQLRYNSAIDSWGTMAWGYGQSVNLRYLQGHNIWKDGNDVYFSAENTHYVLDKERSTWMWKSWQGAVYFYGHEIWTDDNDIYYSNYNTHTYLDKTWNPPSWEDKTWQGLTTFDGSFVWKDGDHIYYSGGSAQQYELT